MNAKKGKKEKKDNKDALKKEVQNAYWGEKKRKKTQNTTNLPGQRKGEKRDTERSQTKPEHPIKKRKK